MGTIVPGTKKIGICIFNDLPHPPVEKPANPEMDFSKPWLDEVWHIGEPEFVGRFPVRTELTVIGLDKGFLPGHRK